MRRALILAIAVLSLALAAPAGTAIVVQRSIAGLELRMTKAQVRAKLGAPAKVKTGRTAAGVGVGSREADVKAKVAGAKCESMAGARHCYVGKFLPGKRITDFSIRGGRVSSVVVGFVVD